MSTYIAGYIVVAILLLLVINLSMAGSRRRARNRRREEQAASKEARAATAAAASDERFARTDPADVVEQAADAPEQPAEAVQPPPVRMNEDLQHLIQDVLQREPPMGSTAASARPEERTNQGEFIYASTGPIYRETPREEAPASPDRNTSDTISEGLGTDNPKDSANLSASAKTKPSASAQPNEPYRRLEEESEILATYGSRAQAHSSRSSMVEAKRPAAAPPPEGHAESMRRGGAEPPSYHIGEIMTVLLIGAFVTILNQTLINVALPHMMNDLNVSANTIQWLVTGYMLVNGVLIPISAFLVETFGTKKLFITAMMFFFVGSIVCALSGNFSLLLIGRLIQAVGAGIIMPLMMNVFLTVFPPEKRGKAMGIMGVAMIFAPAVGPTLSGWLVENYNWRLLFVVVMPIAILDILFAMFWMKDVLRLTFPKFDLWGAVYSTIGFGLVLYGFSEAGNSSWTDGKVLFSLIVGCLFLLFFVVRSLRIDKPMLNFEVYKFDVFSLTTIISSVITMAMYAAMVLVPIYLQNIRGFTPLQSGLLLLPGALLMGIMSPISGALFDRIGARWLAVFGLAITALTTYQFTKLSMETTYPHILFLYTMRMFGMSFLMMTVMTAGLNQLPRRLNSHGTAMANTMRQVAGSLGTALLVTVMSSRMQFHLANYGNVMTTANPWLSSQVNSLGQGLAAASGMPPAAGQSLTVQLLYGLAEQRATVEGINDAFLWATIMTIIALILSFFIKRVTPPDLPVPHPADARREEQGAATAVVRPVDNQA